MINCKFLWRSIEMFCRLTNLELTLPYFLDGSKNHVIYACSKPSPFLASDLVVAAAGKVLLTRSSFSHAVFDLLCGYVMFSKNETNIA